MTFGYDFLLRENVRLTSQDDLSSADRAHLAASAIRFVRQVKEKRRGRERATRVEVRSFQ